MSGRGQADLNNHANQCNPNNDKYDGHQSGYSGTGTKADLDNHANQLNPNNQEYGGNHANQCNPNHPEYCGKPCNPKKP